MKLTLQRALEVLSYDPLSGELRWRFDKSPVKAGDLAGSIYSNGYRVITIDLERFRSGRLCWFMYYGRWPVGQVDLRNRVRTDDRIENLREATPKQNSVNVKQNARNTSGYRGVSSTRNGKWAAFIYVDGKNVNLGTHATALAAHEAWKSAATETRGDFFAP